MLNWENNPDCVIKTDDVFCSGTLSSFWNQLTDGSGLPSTSQEKTTFVRSSTDWLDGPEIIEGRTSVGPEDMKEKYFTLLYFLVSMHAVIGQFCRILLYSLLNFKATLLQKVSYDLLPSVLNFHQK